MVWAYTVSDVSRICDSNYINIHGSSKTIVIKERRDIQPHENV